MNEGQARLLANAISGAFISPNVADSNLEPANIVDALDGLVRMTRAVANAITPMGAAPAETPNGGIVRSLTEAVFYAAESLGSISNSIHDLAEAIREGRGATGGEG